MILHFTHALLYIPLCQIEILKRRYDDMMEASKKSGSVLYFELLHIELNDCFGALKDVRPDTVFSSRTGLKVNKPAEHDNDNDVEDLTENNQTEPHPSTSSANDTPQKKTPKSEN